MTQVPNPRRGRSRNSGKRNPSQNSRSRNYDGSGSDNKVRGSAQQILDKYLALARDASLSGDRITAEGFHQHAEHYYRVLNPERPPEQTQNNNQQGRRSHHDKNRDQQGDQQPRYHQQKNGPADVAPVEQTAAPVEQAAAPVEQAAAPVEQTAAPVKQMAAPVKKAAAPVKKVTAPVKKMAEPVAEVLDASVPQGIPAAAAPVALPAADVEAAQAVDGTEEDAKPKPRRRGRPRKVPVAEPAV